MTILEVTNDNKDKVKIRVDVYYDNWSSSFRYNVGLEITPYRKRKSFRLKDELTNDYKYRSFDNNADKQDYAKSEFLKYVTEDQINQAVYMAYESLKPTKENIYF